MGRGEGKSTTTKYKDKKTPAGLTLSARRAREQKEEAAPEQNSGAAPTPEQIGNQIASAAAQSPGQRGAVPSANVSLKVAQRMIAETPDAPSNLLDKQPRSDDPLARASQATMKRMLEDAVSNEFSANSAALQPELEKEPEQSQKADTITDTTITHERVKQIQEKAQGDIQKKLAKAVEYMRTPDKRLGRTPEQALRDIYTGLDADPKDIEAHMEMAMSLALHQHADDPEQFVSHGFDHTLSVMKQIDKTLEDNPRIVESTMKSYGITKPEAKFLLKSTGLFHDFGYPYISQKGKPAHALAGADIVADPYVSDLFKRLIKSNAGSPALQNKMLADLREAIILHSATQVDATYGAKVQTKRGTFLFSQLDLPLHEQAKKDINPEKDALQVLSAIDQDSGDSQITIHLSDRVNREALTNAIERYKRIHARRLGLTEEQYSEKFGADGRIKVIQEATPAYQGAASDLTNYNDTLLGLEFKPLDMVNNPLAAILRLGDGTDITPDRLTSLQRHPALLKVLSRLGETGSSNPEVRSAALESQELHKQIQTLQEAISKSRTRNPTQEQHLEELQKNYNELRQRQINAVLREENIPREEAMEIERLGGKMNYESFRHFAGLLPINSVQLKNGEATITVNKKLFDQLNQSRVNVGAVELGVGDFQVWYASDTLQTMTAPDASGKAVPLKVRIIDADTGQDVELSKGKK